MKQQQMSKGFEYALKQMEEEATRRQDAITHQLLLNIPFNRSNNAQTFYRFSEELTQKNFVLRRMGWRISEISREQEDLILYCFNILGAEIPLSTHFFTNETDNGENLVRSLWMEVSVHQPNQSKDFYASHTDNLERELYAYCEYALIPRLLRFIQAEMTWTTMIRQEYSDELVVQKFKQQVVQRVKMEIAMKSFCLKKKK